MVSLTWRRVDVCDLRGLFAAAVESFQGDGILNTGEFDLSCFARLAPLSNPFEKHTGNRSHQKRSLQSLVPAYGQIRCKMQSKQRLGDDAT